ncbi:hypothetical protein [Nonomuraea basaltis]|uniref:hypothetical protein n=1 Tax=Nonomuraea basaltis TaxID=2495887 RepID=UPI00110C44F7|nr:hypothetical protein [Nonomuraea basaltis]TMS00197.1 hypothetical protein EJK15_03740 [Nonomuraea basaltis]
MTDQPLSVPFEPYAQALAEQRNQALDQVAQLQAVVHQLQVDNERLTAENKKLRAEKDGPFGDS